MVFEMFASLIFLRCCLYNVSFQRCRSRHIFGGANIGVAREAKGAMTPPKFLENIVILCFERRFSKENSAIRLKSNIFAPPTNFWAGYATGCEGFLPE